MFPQTELCRKYGVSQGTFYRWRLKVLVYAYATGTYSSRKIARKLHEDVAFRVLAAENFPAHRTISDFRKHHLSDFESVFVQLVRIAKEIWGVRLP